MATPSSRVVRQSSRPAAPQRCDDVTGGGRMQDVAERQRISSGSPFESSIGFSRAVRVGDRVLVSGTAPVVPGGRCPEGAEAQARRCFEIIEAALAEAGCSFGDVV